jgi:hypothetical protein
MKNTIILVTALVLAAGWALPARAATEHHDPDGHHEQAASQHDHHGSRAQPAGEMELTSNGMTPEEGKAYSLFMHRSSGWVLVALGLLLLGDRLTARRHSAFRVAMGAIWFLLGVHVMIRADPGGWPLSHLSFTESMTMPGSGEWIQHKLLSLIPMAFGVYTIASRHARPNPAQSLALAAAMFLGAAGLTIHEHMHEPGLDMGLIDVQHKIMAATSLLIASGSLVDGLDRVTWKPKHVVLPLGLVLLGIELALYIE